MIVNSQTKVANLFVVNGTVGGGAQNGAGSADFDPTSAPDATVAGGINNEAGAGLPR